MRPFAFASRRCSKEDQAVKDSVRAILREQGWSLIDREFITIGLFKAISKSYRMDSMHHRFQMYMRMDTYVRVTLCYSAAMSVGCGCGGHRGDQRRLVGGSTDVLISCATRWILLARDSGGGGARC